MPAFRAAVDIGAGIECDVRAAADGVAVIFHDADLKRLCGADRRPGSLSPHEISDYRLLGTGETIPRLGELLELVGDQVPLLLELKTERHSAEALCRAVAKTLAASSCRAAVMSFDPRVGRWLARHAPEVWRGIVIGADEGALKRWAKLRLSRAQFAAVQVPLAGTHWGQRVRRRMPLLVWTVRSAEERNRLANQADGLIWEGDGRPRI